MTFTEAAVEVLRLVGKPLHYKKITEVAIERNLLSHVGKTPEVTMSSRLATMVKRDRGEAPIIKVKPGVFGLREFSEEQLADLSGDVDELPEVEVTEHEQAKPEEAAPVLDANGEIEVKPVVVPPPRKPLPGADVFPEEEDDDEPILGGDDDDDDDDDEESEEGGTPGEAGASAESRSQRRRRKRRRRGGADEAVEEPRPAAEARPEREAQPSRELSREGRGRQERNARREERNPRRGERDSGRDNNRERDNRERDERRDSREREVREERLPMRRDELSLDMSREPADGDLLGKELADAVASVLAQSGPRGMAAIRVADMLVRKGRLQGDPNALLPTVMAAVRADVARRRHEPRPRFRVDGTSLVLTEFLLPQDVVRAEQDVIRAAERQRERARRAFLRKLAELPGAGLAELAATWLNAEGVVGLRAVRKPTPTPGELHLAGTLRRGPEEVRIAIIICRDGRELGREKVIEARGALHYYGNATTAWLITLGSVMSGAREEALAPATAPVALFDGLALATAMERVGVGMSVQQIAISSLDFELLDSLRGAPAREREREREPEPERGRGRDRERNDRDRPERQERPERVEREPARAGDRDRPGRDRGERDRPRLVLERPPVALEDVEELEEPNEIEEQGEAVAELGSEGSDEELEAAPAEGDKEQGDSREGGRRRRRRRRRKGGRGEEAQVAGVAGEGEAPAVEGDDDDENGPPAEDESEGLSPDDEVPQGSYGDGEDEAGEGDNTDDDSEDREPELELTSDDEDDESDEGDEPAHTDAEGDEEDEQSGRGSD